MSSCTERGITSKQTDKTKCLGLWSWATVTFEYCPSTLGHTEMATLLSPNCYEDSTGRKLRFSVFSLVWIRSTNKLGKYAASPYSFFLGEAGVCFSASYQLRINIPSSSFKKNSLFKFRAWTFLNGNTCEVSYYKRNKCLCGNLCGLLFFAFSTVLWCPMLHKYV